MRGAKAPKSAAWVAACIAAAVAAEPARAVVVVGGGGGLVTRPQLGYIGSWNGASAVAIGPDWIISARHLGGAPGTMFTLEGRRYEASEVIAHPTRDLLLARLTEPLPGWHDLAPLAVAGQDVVLGGMGFQAGNFIGDGYDWTGGTGLAWGHNRLDGVGARMSMTFDSRADPDAVAGEAIFAMLDSGGGVFTTNEAGDLELAGIAVSISGAFGQSLFGAQAFAVNLDPVNAWIVSHISPGEPIASSIAPPTGFTVPPASPPVPAPSSGLVLVAAGAMVVAGRRRR